MLYPAGFWKILGKFLLSNAADFPFFIEQDTPVTCCARIQCHYILCHKNSPFPFVFNHYRKTPAKKEE